MKVIELANVDKIYNSEEIKVHAIKNVTLAFDKGEFAAIVGPSGSGKTTLLNLIGGLDMPTSGKLTIGDTDLTMLKPSQLIDFRMNNIGFVFQSFNLIPYLTVYENVSVGLSLSNKSVNTTTEIDRILEAVNLTDRKDHLPSELSIGQQQRVALARALVKKPSLILADEPTGNLDPETGKEVIDIIRNEHKRGTTVVMITHDPNIAGIAQRTIKIVAGRIVAPA